jgi:predicted Zn-dependent protease
MPPACPFNDTLRPGFSVEPTKPLFSANRLRVISSALLLSATLVACPSPTQVAQQHYEQGMALFKLGGPENLVKADLEFRNALEIKKTLAPAIYGLALVAEQQGKLPTMYSYLNQTLGQDPNHLEAQIKIGKILLDAGQIERAAEACNKALALKPDDLAAQALHAGILLKQGDATAAIAQANKVLKQAPGHLDAIELLATERLLAGDAEAALRHADVGLKAQTDSVALLKVRVQALEKLGRSQEVEQAIRQLIARHPANPAYRTALIRFLVSHDRKDAAEAELRAVAEKDPGDTQAKLEVIRLVHALRGSQAARDELSAMIAKFPDNNELKFALAGLLQAMNEHPAAQALIRAIADQAGDSKDGLKARAQLAALLLEQGDKPGALKLAEAVLAKDNRNEQALLLKASVALDEHRIDQAIGDLRALLRDNPDSPRTLLLLGRAHEMQGAQALAEDQFGHAYQVAKSEPAIGIAYAQFMLRQNQPARAEKLLMEMIAARPNLIPAIELLARARSDQGNWDGVQQAKGELRRLGG